MRPERDAKTRRRVEAKIAFAVLLASLVLVSCRTKSYPQMEYMPDMYRQMSVKPQEADATAPGGIGMRQPPPGAVPRNFEPYRLALLDTTEANKISNPLPATPDVLEAGRKYFNTYCIVCHGARGDGHGFIVPKFTQPPVLYSDKVMNWSDGRIFHVITYGQGLMNSYATQLLPEQRWAIIHYVRALQRAAHPTAEDLKLAKTSPFTLEDDLPDTAKTERWPKK